MRESFDDYVRGRVLQLGRVAYLLTSDAHLAEDLVQQTLIRVASRWERIVAGGDPDPYVRKILYHQAVSWWRRRGREQVVSHDLLPERPAPDRHGEVDTTLAMRGAPARLPPKPTSTINHRPEWIRLSVLLRRGPPYLWNRFRSV